MRNRLIAIALGVLLALGLGEIGARLLLPAPERARVADGSGFAERLAAENARREELRVQGAVDDESAGGVLYFFTPTGMRLRANTHAVLENHRLGGGTVEISTNSLGYRNRELGEPSPGETRVLFLGDSITVQDYLPEEETIVRLVETLSRDTAEPLETINAGVGAIGVANELAILQETGLSTKPDVVVLNWYLNDVQGSAGVEIVKPTGLLAYSRLAELLFASVAGLEPNRLDVSTVSPETDRAWREQVQRKFPPGPGHYVISPPGFNQRIQELFFDWGAAWADGAWERMAPLIEEMQRQAESHGARFLIVAFPVREQVDADFVHDYPQQKLAEIARRIDAPMLDLLPLLRAERRRTEKRLFWDWCHPSPYGSRLIAEAILEFVQREGGGLAEREG